MPSTLKIGTFAKANGLPSNYEISDPNFDVMTNKKSVSSLDMFFQIRVFPKFRATNQIYSYFCGIKCDFCWPESEGLLLSFCNMLQAQAAGPYCINCQSNASTATGRF
jgi:hypothetical protein